MNILAFTPIWVSNDELVRRQERYDRFSPADVTVILRVPGDGSEVPRSLETADDVAASEEMLLHYFSQESGDGFDVFLPDCALDPVVDGPASAFVRPVFGILKLTAHFLASLGQSVGAVARNTAIANELDRKLVQYGLGVSGTTHVLGLSVADISDDATWARATDAMLATTTAAAVINGCSAVEVRPPSGGPSLVDPTAMALRLLGVAAASKIIE